MQRYAHMEVVDEDKYWPYGGPEGYRAAFPEEAMNWRNIPEAIQVRHFFDYNGFRYDEDEVITDIYVPKDRAPVESCIPEFGPHEDHDQCAHIMGLMSDYGDAAYTNEYIEERDELMRIDRGRSDVSIDTNFL